MSLTGPTKIHYDGQIATPRMANDGIRSTVLMLLGVLERELNNSAYSYDYKAYLKRQIANVRECKPFKQEQNREQDVLPLDLP